MFTNTASADKRLCVYLCSDTLGVVSESILNEITFKSVYYVEQIASFPL